MAQTLSSALADAAVVTGSAAWKFDWQRSDYDALAGALTAGHIIECGAQCTGGNYSFIEEIPELPQHGLPHRRNRARWQLYRD